MMKNYFIDGIQDALVNWQIKQADRQSGPPITWMDPKIDPTSAMNAQLNSPVSGAATPPPRVRAQAAPQSPQNQSTSGFLSQSPMLTANSMLGGLGAGVGDKSWKSGIGTMLGGVAGAELGHMALSGLGINSPAASMAIPMLTSGLGMAAAHSAMAPKKKWYQKFAGPVGMGASNSQDGQGFLRGYPLDTDPTRRMNTIDRAFNTNQDLPSTSSSTPDSSGKRL